MPNDTASQVPTPVVRQDRNADEVRKAAIDLWLKATAGNTVRMKADDLKDADDKVVASLHRLSAAGILLCETSHRNSFMLVKSTIKDLEVKGVKPAIDKFLSLDADVEGRAYAEKIRLGQNAIIAGLYGRENQYGKQLDKDGNVIPDSEIVTSTSVITNFGADCLGTDTKGMVKDRAIGHARTAAGGMQFITDKDAK